MTFTTDPSEKLQAVATAIADALSVIDGVTALDYEPLGDEEIEDLTVCVCDVEGTRVAPGDEERVLGRLDWDDEWTVRIYVRVYESRAAWVEARRLSGAVRDAIDADFQLGGEVETAALVSFNVGPAEAAENRPRQIVGECIVGVKYLMPDHQ